MVKIAPCFGLALFGHDLASVTYCSGTVLRPCPKFTTGDG
jgi:hypothetical protein